MGLFKTIGTIVGTAIGTATGNPVLGAKIGSTVGGAVDGKKKSTGTAAASTQYIKEPSKISMEDIRPGGASKAMEILSRRSAEVKVAETAKLPNAQSSDILEDPWKPSRDWWEDLGGEPGRYGPIDDTRMP